MVVDGACWIEAEGELVAPAELEAGFGNGVVPLLGGGVSFGEVGRVVLLFIMKSDIIRYFKVRYYKVF